MRQPSRDKLQAALELILEVHEDIKGDERVDDRVRKHVDNAQAQLRKAAMVLKLISHD